jgi:hypothetical protein
LPRGYALTKGLGRFQELGIYTKAALASGATVDEIKEALVQITVYCGTRGGNLSRSLVAQSRHGRSLRSEKFSASPSFFPRFRWKK